MAKKYDVQYYEHEGGLSSHFIEIEANSPAEAIIAAKAMLGPDVKIINTFEKK